MATIGAAVSDVWGMWKHPKPEWNEHYNLLCLGKRHCTEGTLWKLEGNAEDFYWSLKEVGDGLKPQERLTLEAMIIAFFKQFPEPLPLAEIASKIGTSYECIRRICTEMFEVGSLKRTKVITGQIIKILDKGIIFDLEDGLEGIVPLKKLNFYQYFECSKQISTLIGNENDIMCS